MSLLVFVAINNHPYWTGSHKGRKVYILSQWKEGQGRGFTAKEAEILFKLLLPIHDDLVMVKGVASFEMQEPLKKHFSIVRTGSQFMIIPTPENVNIIPC